MYTPGNLPNRYVALGSGEYAGPFRVVSFTEIERKNKKPCYLVRVFHPTRGELAFCYVDKKTGVDPSSIGFRIIDAYEMPKEEGE